MCGYYILASKRNGTLYAGVTWGIPRRLAIFTVYEARRGTAPSPSSSLMWTAPPCKCFLQIF
jgi:predicted GIY-YIG superfamily endonuclease